MISKLTIAGLVCVIALTTAFGGGFGLEGTLLQTAASLAIATTQTAGDCNGNGIADDEDIANGTSKDCNHNGIPDECDFVAELTATGSVGFLGLTSFQGEASFFYVYPPNGNDRYVGDVSLTEPALKDVAVDPTDNRIYTVNFPLAAVKAPTVTQQLYLVDPVTGAGTALPQQITSSSFFPVLGLTFGLDGTLYGIGQAGLVILDKTTGAISQTVNAGVFGFGMATSPTGQLYSVTIEPPSVNALSLISGGILQLHDSVSGAVTSAVNLTGPQSAERQIVDIAFGADGKLYGIKGYVSADPPSYIAFEGTDLVIIDPATGVWTDVGSVFDNLVGLGGPRSKASLDCNKNGIPDECETDCNGNGIPDDCDIAGGASLDCNSNGVPDECDIAKATSADCNGNSIPDECDILSGAGTDANGDGVLDECQTPQGQDTPAPTGPFCIFFLFQSLFGIPLCGPCLIASMFATLIGLGGMKVYVRRRHNRLIDRLRH